jgi:hypothetical protein
MRLPAPLRNLADSSGVDHPTAALQEAKSEMPKIYTEGDLSLIMLHLPGAQTISGSVTNRERVGRTITPEPRIRRLR